MATNTKERTTPLDILMGEWFDWGRTDHAPRIPLGGNERVLGNLQSPLVPKFLSALDALEKTEKEKRDAPGFAEGVEGIKILLRSQLLSEYGEVLHENESIAVRRQENKWIVVAIPAEEFADVLQAS